MEKEKTSKSYGENRKKLRGRENEAEDRAAFMGLRMLSRPHASKGSVLGLNALPNIAILKFLIIFEQAHIFILNWVLQIM